MNKIKKRQLAEIVIHILFWIAVFYVVNVSTSSAVTIRISRNDAIMERKQIVRFLPATYGTLILLVILFYGNIFWLFKKILSFRSNFVRFAIAICWFLLIFAIDTVAINLLTPRDPVKMRPAPTQQLVGSFKFKGTPVAPPPLSETVRMVPDKGRIVPDGKHRVPDTGRVVFYKGRIVPDTGRVGLGKGRVVSDGKHGVPNTGRVVFYKGRIVPDTGRVGLGKGRIVPDGKHRVPDTGRVVFYKGRIVPDTGRVGLGKDRIVSG